MKASFLLKYLDLAGQLLMLFPLGRSTGLSWNNILLAYCTLGAWQVLSFLLNQLGNPGSRARRAGYAWVLKILACTALFSLLCSGLGFWLGQDPGLAGNIGILGIYILILFLIVLLFLAPVLAIWYFGICLCELRNMHAAGRHRREIHWKL